MFPWPDEGFESFDRAKFDIIREQRINYLVS